MDEVDDVVGNGANHPGPITISVEIVPTPTRAVAATGADDAPDKGTVFIVFLSFFVEIFIGDRAKILAAFYFSLLWKFLNHLKASTVNFPGSFNSCSVLQQPDCYSEVSFPSERLYVDVYACLMLRKK